MPGEAERRFAADEELGARHVRVLGGLAVQHCAQLRHKIWTHGQRHVPCGENGFGLISHAGHGLPVPVRPASCKVVSEHQWLPGDAGRALRRALLQQQSFQVDPAPQSLIQDERPVSAGDNVLLASVAVEEKRSLAPGSEVASPHGVPGCSDPYLVPARGFLADDEAHVALGVGCEWTGSILEREARFIPELAKLFVGHAQEPGHEAALDGEVKVPLEGARVAANAVILLSPLQDKQGDLETFAVRAGLAAIAEFAGAADIQVRGLETGPAVDELDAAVIVLARPANVAQPLRGLGTRARYFENNLLTMVRSCLLTNDGEVVFLQGKGLDDGVSPAGDGQQGTCRRGCLRTSSAPTLGMPARAPKTGCIRSVWGSGCGETC